MLQVIAVGVLILYAAIAWVIFRDYRNTRNIGFLIIGCGGLVWPFASSLLIRIITEYFLLPGNLWTQLLLAQTGNVIQAGLILIGFIAIQRSIRLSANR
jgi:hypothetical protein